VRSYELLAQYVPNDFTHRGLTLILWLYFLADFGSYRDARDAEDSIAKLFSKLSFYPKEYVINKPFADVVIK
jgi:hypothetical protein